MRRSCGALWDGVLLFKAGNARSGRAVAEPGSQRPCRAPMEKPWHKGLYECAAPAKKQFLGDSGSLLVFEVFPRG